MDQLELDFAGVSRGVCLRCGGPLIRRRTGRPRRWCSERCRRLAGEERAAADRGAIAIRLVERVERVESSIDECVDRVVESPVACARVLRAVRQLVDEGWQESYGKWSKAATAVDELVITAYRREATQTPGLVDSPLLSTVERIADDRRRAKARASYRGGLR